MTAPLPGTQVRPDVRIIDDSVFIVLAYSDEHVLSFSAPQPSQPMYTPLPSDTWTIIVRDVTYVLEPSEG